MLSEDINLWSEVHPTKNNTINIYALRKQSNKKIWWVCKLDSKHEWEANISNRSKKPGCPYCSNVRICDSNCLKNKFPDIAKEWNNEKNIISSDKVFPGTNTKYWWKCAINPNHEWHTSPNSRCFKNTGCPHCKGKTTFGGNTLLDKYPIIAKEWHPTKNKPLEPSNICPKSTKKVWWICSNNHEYDAVINNRTTKSGCPYCKGKKSSKENNLLDIFPDIAKEWHPTKNKELPAKFTISSGAKVWWQCSKYSEHEWQTTIVNRTDKKTSCPFCSGKKPSNKWNLLNKYPEIAKEWHPTKNNNLKPSDLTPGNSSKNIWWVCSKNNKHEWITKVSNRTSNKTGCPYCCMSHLEKLTEKYLISNNIRFDAQKKFKELGSLSYDFYLPDYNIVIECDGRQHFENAPDYFHHQKSLLDQRKRDIRKNIFCLKNNISILRIAYTEEKYIDTIIQSFMNRFKNSTQPLTVFAPPHLYSIKNRIY